MNHKLGNKIKQLRLRKGIAQDALARVLNVFFQTIRKWENNIPCRRLQLISAAQLMIDSTFPSRRNLSALRTCWICSPH